MAVTDLTAQLQASRVFWDTYDWSQGGEEWSSSYSGGTAELYQTVIRPRIRQFLPAQTILEIAPGYGRITQYLLQDLTPRGHLIGVDLLERCVAACRVRFATQRAEFHVSHDGCSLSMVPSQSIRFAISWDSLVHVSPVVVSMYLVELARVLTPGGSAFLHHSNLGAFTAPPESTHGRDPILSAEIFRILCGGAGLTCVGQEVFTWGASKDLDCLSELEDPPLYPKAALTGTHPGRAVGSPSRG